MEIGSRKAIAQGARDWNPEPRTGGGDTDIAGIRDGEAGPDREAFDHGDAGYAQALQRVDKAIEPRFVSDAIVAVGELAELRNIGAGDKGVAAAPRSTATRTRLFPLIAAQAAASPSYIAQLIGRAHGRSNRMWATAPEILNVTFPSPDEGSEDSRRAIGCPRAEGDTGRNNAKA